MYPRSEMTRGHHLCKYISWKGNNAKKNYNIFHFLTLFVSISFFLEGIWFLPIFIWCFLYVFFFFFFDLPLRFLNKPSHMFWPCVALSLYILLYIIFMWLIINIIDMLIDVGRKFPGRSSKGIPFIILMLRVKKGSGATQTGVAAGVYPCMP